MSRVGIELESPHQETQKIVTLSFHHPVTLSLCLGALPSLVAVGVPGGPQHCAKLPAGWKT